MSFPPLVGMWAEEEKGKTAGIEIKDEKVRIAYEDVATAKGKGIANQDKGQAT